MSPYYRPLGKTPEEQDGLDTPIVPTDGKVTRWLKRTTIRGFDGHSIYDVGKYFLRSMFRENLNLRASSLSFNFFLSLFPTLIFILTLIASLPVKGLKTRLINELRLILPESTWKEIKSTILELLNNQNSGLLSFGFILALYFASNAFHSLINSFNRRLPEKRRHNWLRTRFRAINLTLLVGSMTVVTLLLLTWLYQADNYILKHHWAGQSIWSFLFGTLEYTLICGLIFTAISSFYHFGPAHKNKWRFVSAGSIFASALSLLSTYTFSLYVNNFDAYDKIYGSIGAIIALMVLIYINCLVVITGFELNASIDKARITSMRAEEQEANGK